MRGRAQRVLALLVCSVVVAVGAVALQPQQAGAATQVTFNGYGWGHGRGMGQYGALGYAVDYGWSYQAILDHYYGGTVLASDAGNGPTTVDLQWLRGATPVVVGAGMTMNGYPVPGAAVRVQRVSAGWFQVSTGPGCSGPWTLWTGQSRVDLVPTDPGRTEGQLRVCRGSTQVGYRGTLSLVEGPRTLAAVNTVALDDYLRGVVPRESPAGWGALGGGRGMQALRAQAVAARSYALASRYSSWAQTCDTITCQVYGGAFTQSPTGVVTSLHDPRTDQAVAETSGQVRRSRSTGAIMRTEFSSSTGGWTTGGVFPAVQDLGDATASNPNRSWSTTTDTAAIAAALGTAPVTGLRVTRRNGLGRDGGRVLEVQVDTTSGPVTFTGNQVRSALGLKSDWFSVSGMAASQARAFVTAAYTDLLRRSPSPAEVAYWEGRVTAGLTQADVASSFALSGEGLGYRVDDVYVAALGRSAEPAGKGAWVRLLAAGAPYPQVVSAIYGSPESLQVLGGGDTATWVGAMYARMLGRAPEPGAAAYWERVATVYGRGYVAEVVWGSREARMIRLNWYYTQMLGRGVDPAGYGWADLLLGRGDLTLPINLASTPEYLQRSRARFPS